MQPRLAWNRGSCLGSDRHALSGQANIMVLKRELCR